MDKPGYTKGPWKATRSNPADVSTQGQGDVAQQSLEERVSQFHTCRLPGQHGIHMGTAALIDDLWKEILTQRDAARKSQSHADRLRALLSSSRGEQDDLEPGELRPCPFCGARAEVVHFEGPECSEDDANFGGSCVQCTRCKASSAVVFGYKETLYSGWNERAVFPSAPGSVPTSLAGQGPDGWDRIIATLREFSSLRAADGDYWEADAADRAAKEIERIAREALIAAPQPTAAAGQVPDAILVAAQCKKAMEPLAEEEAAVLKASPGGTKDAG